MNKIACIIGLVLAIVATFVIGVVSLREMEHAPRAMEAPTRNQRLVDEKWVKARASRWMAAESPECRTVQPVAVEPELLDSLKKSIEDVVVAFSNQQVAVMGETYSRISQALEKLPKKLHHSVMMPLFTLYSMEVVRRCDPKARGQNLPVFSDTAAFRRYFECVLGLAHLIGQAEMCIGNYSNLDSYEAFPLCYLKLLRKQFEAAGELDLVACADQLTARLIEQIESEAGLTRLRMRRIYDDNLPYIGEDELSREECLKAYRTMGTFLIIGAGGYEPRWLKEFP